MHSLICGLGLRGLCVSMRWLWLSSGLARSFCLAVIKSRFKKKGLAFRDVLHFRKLYLVILEIKELEVQKMRVDVMFSRLWAPSGARV